MAAQVISLFSRRPVLELVPQPQAAPERVSEEELVLHYLATKRTKQTREDYARDIRKFRAFIGAGTSLYDVKQHHGDDWRIYRLDTLEDARSSVRRGLSAVGGLYSYAVDEDLLSKDPFRKVAKPEVGDNVQYTGLGLGDIRALTAYVFRRDDLRMRAVVSMLVTTGLRVSELCNSDQSDLRMEDGKLWLHVIRKGGKRDKVEVPQTTHEALTACVGGRSSGPLLLGERGGRLSRHVAWRIVRAAGDAALPHLKGRLHPHDLRHSFVSGVLILTRDVREAQWRAGHTDINNTMRYAHALQAAESTTAADLEELLGISG